MLKLNIFVHLSNLAPVHRVLSLNTAPLLSQQTLVDNLKLKVDDRNPPKQTFSTLFHTTIMMT